VEKVGGEDMGAGRPTWASAIVGFRRLLIIGPSLAPKGSYVDSTYKDFVGKAVPRLVGELQVYDGGPMDPRPLHLHLRIKLTLDQWWRRLGGPLPWISDVARATRASGGA